MNPSMFELSRLEFRRIEVEANPDFVALEGEVAFPQLEFDFKNVRFELATSLDYPDNEIEDPRHFTLALKIAVKQSAQKPEISLPYSVTIEGYAYLHFRGNEEGLKRFQLVRGTGYLMLYGAYRECVANFTSRSLHGLWFLPTPNFNKRVEEDAPHDVSRWEERRLPPLQKPKKSRSKSVKE